MAKLTGWRKVASVIWRAPENPQIFGAFECDARPLSAFIEAARAAGHHVTPTHLVGRAVAHALHEMPDLNTRFVAGRAVPRRTVDIFFITAVEADRDLSGVKVERADRKSAVALAHELADRARGLKEGRDPIFTRTKRTGNALPRPILRQLLRFSSWWTGNLDRDFPALGLERSPFGSAMVTSVGMFGIPMGFAPLASFFKVPLMVLAGEIADKPVAVDGRVEVRPSISITATIDHRVADGWHISQVLRHFRAYMADPQAFELEMPAPAAGAAGRAGLESSAPAPGSPDGGGTPGT
ncbi:2-oxo acid dehydrogenase subunit E2 [Sorangium sp. So ce363]|uniref:2-oxo acid dehydrogenase subunit E2 n=1 Tax=Sorangium sp. So ce363 TaxID=3133304 RepID=UPI003F5F1E38